MPIKFVISDANGNQSHAETIRAAAILGSGGLLQVSDFLMNYQNAMTAYALAASNNALGLIRCIGGIGGIQGIAGQYYREHGILSFMALGSNDPGRLIFTPDKVTSIIACGAGDTENRTGSGWSLCFWDQDTVSNETWESSYSTGYIAGMIYKIKATLACSWWEAVYRARVTASEAGVQDIVNGFGKIDAAAAIAYEDAIADDPFESIGEVGELEIVRTGNQVTLTAPYVDNMMQQVFEKNTGTGWVEAGRQLNWSTLYFTTNIEANVETLFRYKAINESEESEYSNEVSALYEVAPESDPIPIEEQVQGWFQRRPRRGRLFEVRRSMRFNKLKRV